MHGAVTRVANGATPLVRHAGTFTYFVSARWRAPRQATANMDWVAQAVAAMHPLSAPGTYVNYLSENTEPSVAAAYGENYPRLVALKRKYDPKNIFHHNRNIRP
jgi:FAD/FMN-containing dehydrogenase